jgi:ferredoxin-fold anticodon binding domain-containing protein
MLELILILSLLGNGWLLQERGEMEQGSEQMQQVILQQEELIGGKYSEITELEKQLVKVEIAREEIFTESEERSIELEKLRNSIPDVDTYLNQRIPPAMVEHLRSYRED